MTDDEIMADIERYAEVERQLTVNEFWFPNTLWRMLKDAEAERRAPARDPEGVQATRATEAEG